MCLFDKRLRPLCVASVLLLLGACTQPIPAKRVELDYSGPAPNRIDIASVDHRPYVLSSEKKEWFEGIVFGSYGIPNEIQRPGPNGSQPFAGFLSGLLAQSLANAGSNVHIVAMPKGTAPDAARQTLARGSADVGMLVMIRQSRYMAKRQSAEYQYELDVEIMDGDGNALLQKRFQRFDTGIPLSEMYAGIYKKAIDHVLNDPAVRNALTSAIARSGADAKGKTPT